MRPMISEGILSDAIFNNYYRLKKESQFVSQKKNKTKAIDYSKEVGVL